MAQDGTSARRGDLQVTRRGDLFDPVCATRALLDRIGGKWTAMLVHVLAGGGEERFSVLARAATGISRKVLTQTLRDLERDGLVVRRVEPSSPPKVFYALTPLGRSLVDPLDALRDWAEAHMAEVDRHRAAHDAAAAA